MKVKSAQDSDGANRQAIGEIKVPEGPEEADFAELCQDHLQPVCASIIPGESSNFWQEILFW